MKYYIRPLLGFRHSELTPPPQDENYSFANDVQRHIPLYQMLTTFGLVHVEVYTILFCFSILFIAPLHIKNF